MGELPISCKGIDFDIMNDKVFIINRNGMKTEFSYFDVNNHIKDYVDIGYCSGMNVIQKDGKEYLRIKFPKKESDLREYFGYNEKKVSNNKDISNCNPKYLYYDDILNMDEDEVDSYLCGLISANCSVNVSNDYRRECVRFKLPEKREKIELRESKGDTWFPFYEKISKCITYSSGKGLGVMCSIPDLEYFIKNIGIIQKEKMFDIIRLFFSKINKSKDYSIAVL